MNMNLLQLLWLWFGLTAVITISVYLDCKFEDRPGKFWATLGHVLLVEIGIGAFMAALYGFLLVLFLLQTVGETSHGPCYDLHGADLNQCEYHNPPDRGPKT